MAVFKDIESKQEIFDLIDKFDKSNLFELEISIPPQPQYTKIKMMKLSQNHPEGPAVRVSIEDSEDIEENFEFKRDRAYSNLSAAGGKLIKAPLIGTFYSSPSPDSEAFVKVGDKVAKGEIICIIEAMKTMNEIESDKDGEIAEILARNATPVEYGQPLFRLK